jgi:hypothetical protein
MTAGVRITVSAPAPLHCKNLLPRACIGAKQQRGFLYHSITPLLPYRRLALVLERGKNERDRCYTLHTFDRTRTAMNRPLAA